ncbi:tripartite tricarboxylate transporter substrate binding protein [Roseomonas alkaliterrae]|uniref:Tripartite-type tricarboxylate transporter receptor subunit TctC n=1 Tax=Neoroseomonas alkaliterrae TaxID=1452450 RepID=A0A840Y529_9PROT|nr:tripartite tricarboxylate transporter substrate binding protein [Neoroseomonas alkaliterrae]MBB5691467.1 tripartite-type tricarboxylate transporter receptor subunit TctC [Neoroseomonas alkaliterrae]MBR0675689.1 tripartite tricarboxylate transporter substrate binding protein [Neoroseomonas alkaliterrae]
MITRRSLGALAALPLLPGAAAAQAFPARELTGIIMWGAGGATDVVARALTPIAERALGQSIVLQNRPGGAGAISVQAVATAAADGHTLLYGAENPQLHKVLGLGQRDYADFFPVNLTARGVAVVVANKDKPWASMKDVVAEAQRNPGRLRMGATGPGGLPHVVGAMINTVTQMRVIAVPFDGEGPGLTALQGGHVDFMPVGLGAAAEHIRAGRVKPLAVVNTEAVPTLPDVPPITADLPGMARLLPWGPFYGVWVRREVPEAARTRLVAAFREAASSEAFTTLMRNAGNIMMNISGEEADAFLRRWQSVTAWTLQEAGAARRSPEEFGIPRP